METVQNVDTQYSKAMIIIMMKHQMNTGTRRVYQTMRKIKDMSDSISEKEAQEAAQIIRDYSYQIGVSNEKDERIRRMLSSLGLDTDAPIDL